VVVSKPKKHGRKSSLHVDILIYLCLQLEEDSQLTIQQLVTEVESKFKIETSTSAIDRALEKMDITWKNVLLIPLDWNSIEVIKSRMKFVQEKILPFIQRPKIYIDEAGFNWHVKRSKVRTVANFPATLTLVYLALCTQN